MSKIYIISIIALIFLCVAATALGWFLYTVSASGVELTQKMELIADRNAKVKMHTELSRLIERTQTARTQLSRYVLTEDNTSSFLTSIEQTGRAVGVELITRSLQVVPQEGKFDSLMIEFTVEGRSDAVRAMLLVFESLPYHSQVETLTLIKEDADRVSAEVGLKVTLGKYDE